MLQTTKRFGLQKLKKIAGGPNSRWVISPHFVLETVNQLRNKKLLGKPRILVRTDEKGKTYKHLEWGQMPRFDVITSSDVRKNQKAISKTEGIRFNYKTPPDTFENHRAKYSKLRKYIIHPTRPREEIAIAGRVTICKMFGKTLLSFFLSPTPSSFGAAIVTYEFKNGRIKKVTDPKLSSRFKFDSSLATPEQLLVRRKIVANALKFLKKGIESKQINPRRFNTVFSFLTWKDAPTKLELYDLIERRLEQQQPKKN